MKVGIDVRMIEHSGIGIRIRSLLKELDQNKTIFEFTLFGVPDKIKNLVLTTPFRIVPYDCKIYSIREFLGHSEMKSMDILYIPHFNVPIRFLNKCVVTIHDLIPIKMKQFYPSLSKQIYLYILFHLIKRFCRLVITVSEHTKKDLIEIFSFHNKQIKTIYNGVDTHLFQPYPSEKISYFKNKYQLPENFLLCVGIGKKHKNLEFLIQNLKVLWKEKKINFPLVIGGLNEENKKSIGELCCGYKKFIQILPRLEFEEVPLLYNSAMLFIYPSLYEGFGLPVLESSACKCPILSSNATVLPEILKDTVYYFNPRDSSNFQSQLLFILQKKENLHKNIQKAYRNAYSFSWKKTVKSYLSMLGKL